MMNTIKLTNACNIVTGKLDVITGKLNDIAVPGAFFFLLFPGNTLNHETGIKHSFKKETFHTRCSFNFCHLKFCSEGFTVFAFTQGGPVHLAAF